MDRESSTIEQIRTVLERIETGKIPAYDGFKNVRWLADVSMIVMEMESGTETSNRRGAMASREPEL